MDNGTIMWNTTTMMANFSDEVSTVRQKMDPCENDMVERFVTNTIVEMPIASLGILGNIMSFIVLCRQKQKLTTTILLQCLAVMDTLILISAILLRSLRYMHICVGGLHHYYSNYHIIFRWLYPLVYFFRQAQTWLIMLLTIDRWIAVCRPLHAQRLCTLSTAYKQMTAVLVAALVVTIPRFFEVELKPNDFGFEMSEFSKNKVYTIVYRIVIFFIIMYLIPMVTLIVLNTQLILTLRRATIYRAQMQSRSVNMSSRNGAGNMRGGAAGTTSHRSITIIVCVVVIVCILCNLFAMTAHLLWSLAETFEHLDMLVEYRRHLTRPSNILITISSAINFFIYCLCSRNFRSVLVSTFLCRRHCALRNLKNRNRRNNTCNSSHTSLTYMPVNTRTGAKQCIISIEKSDATACRL